MSPKAKTKRKAGVVSAASSSSSAKKPKIAEHGNKPLSFPSKVSKNWTIAQLREESLARGLDVGNIKHEKSFYLGVLGDGSMSVLAAASKTSATNTSKAKSGAPSKAQVSASSKTASSTTTSKKKNHTPAVVSKSKLLKKPAAAPKKSTASTAKPTSTNSTSKKKNVAVSTAKASKETASKKKVPSKITSSAAPKKSTASTAKPVPTTNTNTTPKKKNLPASTATASKKTASKKKVSSKIASSAAPKKSTTSTANLMPTTCNNTKKSALKKTTKYPAKNSALDYPRVTSKLTIAQLKDEARARQLDPDTIPKLKADLLHHLIEGSIHVEQSQEYKAYQALLAKVQNERVALHDQSLQKKRAAEARKEELHLERQAREEQKRVEEQRQQQVLRCKELAQQKSLHVHSFPRVHQHDLAKHSELMQNGSPRNGVCDLCNGRQLDYLYPSYIPTGIPVYSCDSCDWDICQKCFDKENMSEEEKQRIRVERQRKRNEEHRRAEEAQRLYDEEHRQQEEEDEKRWNAYKRFKSSIIRPPVKHLDVKSKLKFTVWCSDGYDPDGWHSYGGQPDKEFDSVWNTKKEANDRAEYLFFWKNPWGTAPNEVSDEDGDPEPEDRDGLKNWSVSPPDSTRWSVGIVPANAFMHLPNVTTCRHNFDDGSEPQGYEPSYSICY